MKAYTEYMNKISVDTSLHSKIINKVTKNVNKKQNQFYRSSNALQYAIISAGIIILVIYALSIPVLNNKPSETVAINPSNTNENDINIFSSTKQQIVEQDETVINITPAPNSEESLCALTLNNVDLQTAMLINIPGHFWYGLTGEQLNSLLPDFPFSLQATVHYYGDGSIFCVGANEISANGDIARFNDIYTLTEIKFAPGEIVNDYIYNYEAKTSDVYGIPVIAGVLDSNMDDGVALYIASFKMEGISYAIELHDSNEGESGLDRLTVIVNAIIKNGAPDLTILDNPVIPELRDEKLTLEEARSDPDFGAYLPTNIAPGFIFELGRRFINQETNSLSASWYTGYDYIHWSVSKATAYDRKHIVYADEREKYDLALYPIPRADSVPRELSEYVSNPVFLAEEFSMDIIKARAYQVDDKGDTPGWRMDFSVMYDELIIHLNIKGASPEQVWGMLSEVIFYSR